MGLLVFTLQVWACILWASVLRHCLLPQTVQAQRSPGDDLKSLLKFLGKQQQHSAPWATWNEMDNNCCGWIGVSCTSDLQVQELMFSGWGLESFNFEGLDELESLQKLNLASNKFPTAPDVSGLIRLTWLDLSGNKLARNPITLEPTYNEWNISSVNVNKLVSLQYLNLAASNIAGNISWLSWDGLVELKALSLSDNQLWGSIPDLQQLSSLVSLDLSVNNLTGGIPNVEGFSTHLIDLNLANNQLTGKVPNMEALQSLSYLYLGGNMLTGFNESGFGGNSVKIVDISRNKLGGPLPRGLGSVGHLDLSFNMLSGNIPDDIRDVYNNQHSVVYLNDNQLSGSIPPSLINAQCWVLDLHNNFLEGDIPEGGSVVYTDADTYLFSLDLRNNTLSGSLPHYNSFLYLLAGGNRLSGDIIEYLVGILTTHTWALGNLLFISLPGNLFTGDITALFAELAASTVPYIGNAQFDVFDLSNNSLHMSLRTGEDSNPLQAMLEDPHMGSVRQLLLAGNNLTGISLPQSLNRSLTRLVNLDLSNTSLEGEIPDELFSSLGSLTSFSVSMNNLSGVIPAKLPVNLQYLEINDNQLVGEIHDEIFTNLSSLLVFKASNNIFDGHIPTKLPVGLQVLEIGDNQLEGDIPDEIFTNLSSLQVFNASNNMFNGSIPTKLPLGLQVLDLSGNNFSGGIPADFFFRLPNLTFFSVSNNNLAGPIPGWLPSQNFTAASFANNPGLCGDPLPACEPPQRRMRRRMSTWVVIMLVLGPTAVSLASCLLLAWKWRSYSKQHKQDAGLINILLKRLSIMPLEDLQKATNNFSERSKIGEGGGGLVYKGELKDGTKVAVKTSKDRDNRGVLFGVDRQQFLTEVDILSRVHHRHLVKLLGCSMQRNKAALVYEYVPNGTLEDHLRGKMERPLSWKQRLLIALQTSEALDYLHYAADPRIIHTDVKPSNILLDEDLHAKVADFGISTLAPRGATYVETAGAQGTFGYMDPEYFQTRQLTAKSDVYSFGAVLLQLISARSPRDILLHLRKEASLEHVARSVMKNGDWKSLVDPCLQNTLDIATGKASIHKTCALAAQCLARTSAKRPEMKEVLKQLQTLWVQHLASCNYGEDLQLGIQEPKGAPELYSIQAPQGAQDHSPLLDSDYYTFTPSSTSTGTHSGSTGTSRSGMEMVTFANQHPRPYKGVFHLPQVSTV